jgi:hypothetical protein
MKFGKYRFFCTLLDDAELPAYKGSTFRGAFGNALKKVLCVARGQDCSDCLLAGRCLYARTFEPRGNATQGTARLASPPPPYVIEPDPARARLFSAGDRFVFNLLLFGEANEQFPYFVYAVEQMGVQGIGRRRQGRRARFAIDQVVGDGRTLYDGRDRHLSAAPYGSRLQPDWSGSDGRGRLTVELRTPLRVKSENRLQAELSFSLLVRTLLRRVSGLFGCYGPGEPDLDYRGLVARAGQVSGIATDLAWCDWQRYSGRQEKTMLMGGMVGAVCYRDVPADYLPLFELGRLLHLGKQTSFGLGAIDYRWEACA